MVCWAVKSIIQQVLFFSLTITKFGRLAEIWWSVCISKFQRTLWFSFSRTDSGLYIYHFFVWSNFSFLHNSQCITFPAQSCLLLHSFCANLLQSFKTWLIVSCLSPHNQHLLFCCVLSIVGLTLSFLMALFCAAVRRDSVSRWRFPFFSHIQLFSYELSLVCCLKYQSNCFFSSLFSSNYCSCDSFVVCVFSSRFN